MSSKENGVITIGSSVDNSDKESVTSQKTTSDSKPTTENKPKRFLNGWTKEQEKLMADWSDIAACYRWLHDRSEKMFHKGNLSITLPVIILSTLTGTANFALQSIFGDNEESKKYASFGIGATSILAGILTTVGNYLRYAQLEEAHRLGSISWGKFQRLIAVELALHPNERMDSLDFLKICRNELDRLIEQSPPIPTKTITEFEHKFGSIKDLKKPDVCGQIERTQVFQSNETRLKKLATEAALMLRRKKQTLSELVIPDLEQKINYEVEQRLEKKILERKQELEELEKQIQQKNNPQEQQQEQWKPTKNSFEHRIQINKSQKNRRASTRLSPDILSSAAAIDYDSDNKSIASSKSNNYSLQNNKKQEDEEDDDDTSENVVILNR
jgi:hypothetical protein